MLILSQLQVATITLISCNMQQRNATIGKAIEAF